MRGGGHLRSPETLSVPKLTPMDEGEPVLRVVRGAPTPEELAALVGVLALRRRREPALVPAPAGRWRATALPHTGLRPGPGAWRASTLPHR
jgi:acyl-CoA carboxylase epsilon subunit